MATKQQKTSATQVEQPDAAAQQIDWPAVEREYRAGIMSVRAIAAQFEISESYIRKRASTHEWSRDLQAKIQASASEKVRREVVRRETVRSSSAHRDTVSEKKIVDTSAEVMARADLLNRSDVLAALDNARSMLTELAELGRKDFSEALAALAEANLNPDRNGVDRTHDLFLYIVSLPGRVKMAKELAGTFGVYIPLQRKVLKLDTDANDKLSEMDQLLKRINGGD